MTSRSIVPPLNDQVREAFAVFNDAHIAAETAIARYADLKAKVGANESERKAQKTNTPEDVYAGYLTDYAAAERDKIAAVAIVERAEKALNVLRELLNHEVEQTRLRAADRYFEAMTIADTTAQRYAVMPGNYTTHAEFRARYPTTGNGIKRATVDADDDPDSLLPF